MKAKCVNVIVTPVSSPFQIDQYPSKIYKYHMFLVLMLTVMTPQKIKNKCLTVLNNILS
jgi:hypothetical protein